jgi:hypothetical protein
MDEVARFGTAENNPAPPACCDRQSSKVRVVSKDGLKIKHAEVSP